jgi:hypothetical protein
MSRIALPTFHSTFIELRANDFGAQDSGKTKMR